MLGKVIRPAVFLLGLTIVFAATPAQADEQDARVAGRTSTEKASSEVMGIHVRATSNASNGATAVTAARQLTGNRAAGFTSRRLTRSEVSAQAAATSGYTCVKRTTSSSNLVAYRPVNIDLSNSEWEVHYTNHRYSMGYARYVSGRWTTQFEQCTIGGSRNKTWRRLANTESEVSIGAGVNRKIGAKWGTGVDDGEVSSSINFSVSLAKAVTISASLPMTTGGTFQGT